MIRFSVNCSRLLATLSILLLHGANTLSAQSDRLFPGISFDSSYRIIGIGQGYDGKVQDSLPRFWFCIDDPKQMEKLNNDWIFLAKANHYKLEQQVSGEIMKR